MLISSSKCSASLAAGFGSMKSIPREIARAESTAASSLFVNFPISVPILFTLTLFTCSHKTVVIDEVDEQLLSLLAKRMHISQEIGTYKKEHNMPILQNKRYDEILDKRGKMGQSLDLDPEFISEIMKAIHEESVKVQMEIMK